MLRSGSISDWYLDGRRATFDGTGGLLAGRSPLAILDGEVTVVGGTTMGAARYERDKQIAMIA